MELLDLPFPVEVVVGVAHPSFQVDGALRQEEVEEEEDLPFLEEVEGEEVLQILREVEGEEEDLPFLEEAEEEEALPFLGEVVGVEVFHILREEGEEEDLPRLEEVVEEEEALPFLEEGEVDEVLPILREVEVVGLQQVLREEQEEDVQIHLLQMNQLKRKVFHKELLITDILYSAFGKVFDYYSAFRFSDRADSTGFRDIPLKKFRTLGLQAPETFESVIFPGTPVNTAKCLHRNSLSLRAGTHFG